MKFTIFISHYIVWHYSRGIRSFFRIWGDFLWFAYNFFSVPLLLRTLFSPFQRLGEEYKRTLDVGAFISTFIVNSLMRCIGALARSFVILLGILSLCILLVAGLVLFLAWLSLPFVIFSFLVLGVYGIVN